MWPKRDKEKDRFYLFPGQGGRAMRRKRNFFLAWAVAAGLVVSIVVAVAMYLVNTHH